VARSGHGVDGIALASRMQGVAGPVLRVALDVLDNR
jgi:hypothetical protein